jgi:hypothetical protein
MEASGNHALIRCAAGPTKDGNALSNPPSSFEEGWQLCFRPASFPQLLNNLFRLIPQMKLFAEQIDFVIEQTLGIANLLDFSESTERWLHSGDSKKGMP